MSAKIQRRPFTEDEAQAKVGKRVCSAFAFWAIQKGTPGTVIDTIESLEGFDVIVKWELDRPSPGKPLRDWFTKVEYERFLEEIGA